MEPFPSTSRKRKYGISNTDEHDSSSLSDDEGETSDFEEDDIYGMVDCVYSENELDGEENEEETANQSILHSILSYSETTTTKSRHGIPSSGINNPIVSVITDDWTLKPSERTAIPFKNESGLKITLSGTTPTDFFFLLFTDQFLESTVSESNSYAMEILSQSTGPYSRINRFKTITLDEIKKFFGVIFLMGLIRLNRLSDYWRTHYLFRLSFPNLFSRDRFLLILRVLNFSAKGDTNDRIKNIRPLIKYFNSKMDEIYAPQKELSLDESAVLWGDRLIFKRFLSNEQHKYGMKLYILAEPSGLVQRLHVYAGAGDLDSGGANHASKVVRKLLEGRTGKGHSIFMSDNYNSVTLAEELLQLDTYCTGILRPKLKDNPVQLYGLKLNTGDIVAIYNSNGICVSKWKDKRDILSISSEFGGEEIETVNKKGVISKKPRMVVEYTKNMIGVDRHNQMISYYPFNHKTLRWYTKLGIHIFHIMLINCHYMYNKFSGSKHDLHDFQLEICQNLLPDPYIPLVKPPSSVSVHLPKLLPRGENGKTKRKQCKLCMHKLKKRIDVIYCCSRCPNNPGFCLESCFKEFHNY